MRQFAAFEMFDKTLHGGDEGDTPEGQFLMLSPITNMKDACFFILLRKQLNWVQVYHWISPISKSDYTLCIPYGIILLQKRIRKRFLGKMFKEIFFRRQYRH